MTETTPASETAMLTPAEAAARLRCSTRTIRRAIVAGVLPAVQVSPRVTRIPEAEFLVFLKGGGFGEQS